MERRWVDYIDYFKISSTLIIPEGCKRIKYSTFWKCRGLKEVIIPESVKSIGREAFMGCRELEKVVIPENVIDIGYASFSGCIGLKKISIPRSVEKIGDYAFVGCLNAEITVRKPKEEFKYFGKDAFFRCKSVVEYVEEKTRN